MAQYDVQGKALDQKNSSNSSTRIVQLRYNNMASIIQMAKTNPQMLTQNDVMVLQKTIGNGAVNQLINGVRDEQNDTVQKKGERSQEEESLQMKVGANIFQRVEMPREEQPVQTKKENNTGLSDNLKAGVENLSGLAMDDVRVHYNSDKPVKVGALAYTQGTDIHVAPGQEKHLPHEAWHVVQQAQGRVKPTMQLKGVQVNDDLGLEKEADEMGGKVSQLVSVHNEEGISYGKSCEVIQMNRPTNTKKRQSIHKVEKDDEEDDEEYYEADDIQEVSNYWARTVVRSKDENKCAPDTLRVLSVSISPERRLTKSKDGKQGDHIVAWSVMVRYWQSVLNGNLSDVANNLRDLLVADEVADEAAYEAYKAANKVDDKAADRKNNSDLRARAIKCIIQIQDKENKTTSQYLSLIEEAISMFVEANQKGAFATQGKASGGKSEGESRRALEIENSNLAELDEQEKMEDENSGVDKLAELGEQEKMKKEIQKKALNLIDIKGKQLDDKSYAKAICTWRTMLDELFPNLKSIFVECLDNYIFKAKTVSAWKQEWETYLGGKRENVTGKLQENAKKLAANPRKSTGVLVNAGPEVEATDATLTASEVKIKNLELPETLRAKTQFGNKQGAHTLAWTFIRQSLENRLENKNANEILNDIDKLVNHDLVDFDTVQKGAADLKGRFEHLRNIIGVLKEEKKQLEFWIIDINSIVREYIEVNQLLPSTTYASAGRPESHGEPSANKKFADDQVEPKNLTVSAAMYFDLGIIYKPMLKELEEYGSLDRRTTMIMKRSRPLSKRMKVNAGEDISALKPEEEKVIDRFKELEEKLVNKTQNFAGEILVESELLLKKILGDYYIHMEFFHPRYFAKLKEATEKEKLLKIILKAPLKDNDNMIGQPIRAYLGQQIGNNFAYNFGVVIDKKTAELSKYFSNE